MTPEQSTKAAERLRQAGQAASRYYTAPTGYLLEVFYAGSAVLLTTQEEVDRFLIMTPKYMIPKYMIPKYMTPEQMRAEVMLKSAGRDLAYARIAYEATPGDIGAVRQLAKAVQDVQAADRAYMAAMTTGLAAQISEIVPDAFRE